MGVHLSLCKNLHVLPKAWIKRCVVLHSTVLWRHSRFPCGLVGCVLQPNFPPWKMTFLRCCSVQSGRNWQIASIIRAIETSVSFHQTTRRNVPEGSHPDTRRLENLKSLPSYSGLNTPVSKWWNIPRSARLVLYSAVILCVCGEMLP
jgi:hypothetical protein